MPVHEQRSFFLVLVLLLFVSLPLTAQATPDASDQPKRQRAIALFHEGKRLEALPLLDELAQKDPKDSEVLVALAASLVDEDFAVFRVLLSQFVQNRESFVDVGQAHA